MAMGTALQTLTASLAKTLNIGDSTGLLETLKATAFKGPASDAQLTALLIVANQYGLNPWTKEIYAFPDKSNGIVPLVSVDGWMRIINNHPAFDGLEVKYSEKMVSIEGAKPCPEWCEVTLYRKDRTHPTVIREYLDEVYQAQRGNYPGPWQTHTKRFHRHKTLIQGSRIAFGFGGIYDEDEAQRILEKDVTPPAAPIGKQAASGNATDDRRPMLVEAARNVAMDGDVTALRAHFVSLSKEDRAIIGTDEMTSLAEQARTIAEKAKSEAQSPIDAEFEEIPL